MDEYIEREALMAKLDEEVKFYISDRTLKGNFAAGVLCDMRDGTIAKFPAADVEPVRHGRWLCWGKNETPTYENYGTCSVCGEDAEIYTEHRNYCPNCGAKMDGDG